MGCQDCGQEQSSTPGPVDGRTLGTLAARREGRPVLGPNLGGGLSGSGLTDSFSLPTAGGGVIPAITHIAADEAASYPQTRQDFHFDFSTPHQLNAGQRPGNEALWRSLGGLV